MKKGYFKLCGKSIGEKSPTGAARCWLMGERGETWHEDGYCENTCKTLNELFSRTQNKPTYTVYYSQCWTPLWQNKNVIGVYSDAHLFFKLNILTLQYIISQMFSVFCTLLMSKNWFRFNSGKTLNRMSWEQEFLKPRFLLLFFFFFRKHAKRLLNNNQEQKLKQSCFKWLDPLQRKG